MAKKASGKGKEKKLARKAETARAAALDAQLRALNEASACGAQLATQYPAFQQYNRHGLSTVLRFFGAGELPPMLLDWALGLTRRHMAALYDACPNWGWSDASKRAELAHPDARFLCIFQQQPAAAAEGQQAAQAAPPQPAAPAGGAAGQENEAASSNGEGAPAAAPAKQQKQGQAGAGELGSPVAFLHFRYEAEEGEAVLYCYEIQVAEAVQGKGIGRFLMQLLELLGRRSGAARLMLTVFHENRAALALYRKIGYALDSTSPGAVDPAGDHKYEIMSKRLRPPQAAQPDA